MRVLYHIQLPEEIPDKAEVDRLTRIHNEILQFAQRIEEKYSDCRKYRLFHILIGSTVPSNCDKTDFEGEDSVNSFLDSLIEKYPTI